MELEYFWTELNTEKSQLSKIQAPRIRKQPVCAVQYF